MKIKAKIIKNLSEDKLLDGIRVAFENSEYLYKSAIILKRNKKYGIAISILTLSLEESMKAISLFIALISRTEIQDENFLKDLFDSRDLHVDRLDFALVINSIFRSLNNRKISKMNFETPEKFMDELMKTITSPKTIIAIETDRKAVNNWFLQANTRKNSGFYVSFDSKWLSPKSINESEFLKAQKETKNIRSSLKIMSEVFCSPDKNEILPYIEIWKQMFVGFESRLKKRNDTAANSR